MDYAKTVEGIIIIVLAAVILADGVMSSIEAIDMEPFLSLPIFKFLVGLIALVLGAAYMEESRRKSSAS